MPNKTRGDSELVAGNARHIMRLTLGALAEIESGLGVKSLSDIGDRLKTLGAGDVATIASALLRGAGSSLTAADVLKLETDLGTLIRAIQDAFDSAGLSRASPAASTEHATSASSAPRRDGSSPVYGGGGPPKAMEGAHASPLAGSASSNSASV